MNDTELHLFVNPTAGRGRAGKRLPRIESLLAREGLHPEIHLSRSVGDLEAQVLAVVGAGAERVIVAGGDGSIHEAANGILQSGMAASLGVIPTGTGNDFAKAADIPLDFESATRLLADRLVAGAMPRRVDAGRMNDRYFVNGAGIGLDARVTAIARAYRWPIGDIVYLFAIFRAMIDGIATPDMRITGDEFELEGPVTLAALSNGPWIGGMFHMAPMAENSDGRLELLVLEPVSRLRILALLPKLMRGRHIGEPEVTHHGVTRLSVQCVEPVQSHLDGELQPLTDHYEFELLPQALSLL